MADLVRGRYHVTDPVWSYLGQPVNATQSDLRARSNLDYAAGLALTDGAALTSGVITAVPVPVEYGDPITKVTVLVGATAASTPTHSFACLYSAPAAQAVPARVGTQSADGLTAAIAASAAFTFTLGSTYIANPTDSPQGYLWVAVCVTGTATPTLASYTLATAVAYPWFANSPAKMGAVTSGSALGGSAPATLASPTAQAVTPVVFLT